MHSSIETGISRPKILALHGRGSNSDVTQIQLNNLEITKSSHDIHCINGIISSERPGPGIEKFQDLMAGPWYSWIPEEMGIGPTLHNQSLLDAICTAVEHVLSVIEKNGPFDAIFGFSQGGLIASLVSNLSVDDALASALQQRRKCSISQAIERTTALRSVVIACAGAPLPLHDLRLQAGLGPAPTRPGPHRSLHLIGRNDAYRPWSESLALAHHSESTEVLYLSGGHEVNQLAQDNLDAASMVRQHFSADEIFQDHCPRPMDGLDWKYSSTLSRRAIANRTQMAAVQMMTAGLPETITGLLAAQPAEAPLLRQARQADAEACTTYGQMLSFCQAGGEGDLRRLGVRAGEAVAYLPPPGGSAMAAAAFLSISSQACAVPLSPHMSETDALLALEQYQARHIVVLNHAPAPGMLAAFNSYAHKEKVGIHHADPIGPEFPGLFRYRESIDDFQDLPELANSPAAHCLLLRTSGSTSTPKLVPLRQRDLVLNATILADGLGITAADVTYSVMPLDHIGGLSASILCSMAVGASITCDGVYNPQAMVEALTLSRPQPTWYSAVPTIHNATVRYLQENPEKHLDGQGRFMGHRLRMIRSGAAALKDSDRDLLQAVFGCEVLATYSMSEQMPISQPPTSATGWLQQPESVGVPVAASMAVVDPVTLRPQPFGAVGEVAISGPTVFTGYLNNDQANLQSRFLLRSHDDGLLHPWFLTGDLGQMDHDGTLSLRGRIKELIKKGGEQISPFEVENALTRHDWVQTALCFPVPSDLYGEEVGCALVLTPSISGRGSRDETIQEIRSHLRRENLSSYKFPTVFKIVEEDDLPKTANRKYIRNGLAKVLGLEPAKVEQPLPIKTDSVNRDTAAAIAFKEKPVVDWSTLAGLRFLLACYVMFMHIGASESWGAFANLRNFPWHVHAFFIVAGFSLAVFMPSRITKKTSFVLARVSTMYPLYALALILALFNLLQTCQPSTFSAIFHWTSQPDDMGRAFCEGTPLIQGSWIANLFSTLAIYFTGLSATPLWGASWFMGFYLWFISMYIQCLVIFPLAYNALYKNRGKTGRLALLTALALILNAVVLLSFWYGYAADGTGHRLLDQTTGEILTPTPEQLAMADKDNAVMLGFYLFSPFWMIYFLAGMGAAFLYDALRPSEQRNPRIWGHVADAITLLIIFVSAVHVALGYFPYDPSIVPAALEPSLIRPDAADTLAAPGIVNRMWDTIGSRLFAPITLLWVFALSTGQGMTARILRGDQISKVLAPTAYTCFLFHQMIGQWYYAATRNGEWWNWWSYRKDFYWFSPQSVPVEWYEYFYIVGLVVIFGKLVQPMDGIMRRAFGFVVRSVQSMKEPSQRPARDSLTVILRTIRQTTGMEAKPEWSLEDCGLASLGVVQFISLLQGEFSTKGHKLSLPLSEIMAARDIREISLIIDAALGETAQPPQQRELQAI